MDRFSQFDVNIDHIYHIHSAKKTESWKRAFYKKNRLKHSCGYTMSILTEGKVMSVCGNKKRLINKGDILITAKNTDDYSNESYELPTRFISTIFFTNKPLSFVPDSGEPVILTPKNPDELKGLFEKILEIYTGNSFSNIMEAKICLMQILAAIYKKNYYEPLNLNSILCKVLNFIDREAFMTNINIKELASEYNLSYEYFIRMFSKEIGCSPKKYINSIRLARVCKLLSETDLPISDVASVSGFFDSSYFFGHFKKTYGLSPVEYREKNRKKYDM